jgi:DnaK suppressor protein
MMKVSDDKIDREKRLREMLLRKKSQIRDRIADELGEKMTEDIASTLGPALDEGDLSALEIARDLDYGLLTMFTKMLKNIEHAIDRLDEGGYGECEECGMEIGEKRLQAMPFARYCLACQQETEKLTQVDKARVWMERRARVEQDESEDDEEE